VGSLAIALAVLSAAVGGGTYEGGPAYLVVADDGRSLTTQSIVALPCMPGEGPGALSEQAPRGTRIRSDGSFGWHGPYQVVEGRFAADGRSVSGTTHYLADPRHNCSTAPVRFVARLTRRAPRDGTCEPLSKGRLHVAVFVRRTGCTAATRVVDAWRSDRDCVTLSLGVRPCRAAGRRCAPVAGGRLRGLAGVACRAGRSRIELVIRERCSDLDFSHGLEAINVSCAAARPLGRRWLHRARCATGACSVAGYRCRRLAQAAPGWRCRRAHRAFEIQGQVILDG
jgi:hypothetical protein